MLKKSSKLYLMTELYNEGIDFARWYYKNDPTHVFFYSQETFDWIKKEFGFSDVRVDKRLITFENKKGIDTEYIRSGDGAKICRFYFFIWNQRCEYFARRVAVR